MFNSVLKNIGSFLINIFDLLNRHRIIYDREDQKPYLERYYIFLKDRKKFPFNIFIHKILDDDHGEGVHNHMCPYITIILKGGYWETTIKGKFWRPQGYIGFRSADHLHRVDLKPNTDTITIFIPGPFGLRQNPRAGYNTKLK